MRLVALPLVLKKNSLYKASLDRIDSSLGYIEGNVQWVLREINFMKGNLDEEYFKNICIAIGKYNKGV